MSLEATLAELIPMLDQRLREITAELHRRPLTGPVPDTTTRGIADAHLLWLLEFGSLMFRDLEKSLSVRTCNIIRQTDCKTPTQLARFGAAGLRELHDCKESHIQEIADYLQEKYGLQLVGVQPSIAPDPGAPLGPVDLGVRARKVIRVSGCTTARELAAFGRKRLLEIRNCGETGVREIRDFLLTKYGLELAD